MLCPARAASFRPVRLAAAATQQIRRVSSTPAQPQVESTLKNLPELDSDFDPDCLEPIPRQGVVFIHQLVFERSAAVERYRYYAKRADAQGYTNIARCFHNLARGKSAMAQSLIRQLEDETTADPISGETIGETIENLKAAYKGEENMTKSLPTLINNARESKKFKLVKLFESIRAADTNHIVSIQRIIKEYHIRVPESESSDEDESNELSFL